MVIDEVFIAAPALTLAHCASSRRSRSRGEISERNVITYRPKVKPASDQSSHWVSSNKLAPARVITAINL